MEQITSFIDSQTLRRMLEDKTLPPAVECILIAQSTCRSVTDKINAIRERLDAYTDDEFAAGDYEWHIKDFRKGAEYYINELEKALELLKDNNGNAVYLIEDDFPEYDRIIFDNWKDAFNEVYFSDEWEEYHCISRRKIGQSSNTCKYYLDPQNVLYRIDISNMDWEKELTSAFVELPHEYKVGDIIMYNNTYAVITDMSPFVKKKRLTPLDDTDMALYALQFGHDHLHSCGGAFGHIHVPVLKAELVDLSADTFCPEPLLMLRKVLIGEWRISDFIEYYSNNIQISSALLKEKETESH